MDTHDFIEHIYSQYGEEALRDSGGFMMVCGVIRKSDENPDRIKPFGLLSNRDAPILRLFDSARKTELVLASGSETLIEADITKDTIGVSNSEVTQPWPKVNLGVLALEELVHQVPVPEEVLIEQLKDILAKDTFPLEQARKETSTDGIFSHVQDSIFIPPINVHVDDNTDYYDGIYYGTRTNTIILVSKDGHVKYIERTLHEHDVPVEDTPPAESIIEFDIEGF